MKRLWRRLKTWLWIKLYVPNTQKEQEEIRKFAQAIKHVEPIDFTGED